jgi:hypothetical protein
MHSARIKLTLLDEDGKMIASSILNYGGSAIGSGEAGNTLRGELEARNNENWLLQEENIRLRHAHHDERAEMKILCNTIQARDAANRRLEAKNRNLRGLDSNEGEEGRADAGVIQDCASLRVMATNQLMWTAMPHHTACTWDGTSGDSSYGSGSGSDSSSNEILTQTATRAIIKQVGAQSKLPPSLPAPR